MLWLGELLLIKRSFFTQTTQVDKDQKASKNEKEKVDKKHRLCIKQAKHYLYFTCRIFSTNTKNFNHFASSTNIIYFTLFLRQSKIFRRFEYLEKIFSYYIPLKMCIAVVATALATQKSLKSYMKYYQNCIKI